jgi:hypothetical protein
VDVPIANGFVADVAESKLQRKKSMIESNPEDMADRDRDGMKSNAYIAGLFIREALIETKKQRPADGGTRTHKLVDGKSRIINQLDHIGFISESATWNGNESEICAFLKYIFDPLESFWIKLDEYFSGALPKHLSAE